MRDERERESLQEIVDVYFNVEMNKETETLQNVVDICFDTEIVEGRITTKTKDALSRAARLLRVGAASAWRRARRPRAILRR